jgi:Rhodopirellula transposase DDE domain
VKSPDTVIINLIASTTTNTGLKLYARLDDRAYERGLEIPDEQLAAVNITRHPFHGDWHYTINPSIIFSRDPLVLRHGEAMHRQDQSAHTSAGVSSGGRASALLLQALLQASRR